MQTRAVAVDASMPRGNRPQGIVSGGVRRRYVGVPASYWTRRAALFLSISWMIAVA